jgi:hypothetical protein
MQQRDIEPETMFKKIKPFLITAAVAIAAVMIYNNLIQPRIGGGKLPSA